MTPNKLEISPEINSLAPSRFSVFGLGTIVVDHQVIMATFPETDTKGEVLEDRYQVGGPVPTALSLLRKLGIETGIQGSWSNDTFGEMIEENLKSQSIQYDPTQCRGATRTGFAHVWLEKRTGRRTIAAYRGSHHIEMSESSLRNKLASFDALHLDGWSTSTAINAAKVMKQLGGKVFLDLGSPKPQLESLLEQVDLLNCPARLIEQLFTNISLEEGAKRLLAMGPREITITRGESGAIHASPHGTTQHPGFALNPVDTNGAGDVFSGAILFGTLSQWTAKKKLAFACAAAGLKCKRLGNREALPTLQEIELFRETAKENTQQQGKY